MNDEAASRKFPTPEFQEQIQRVLKDCPGLVKKLAFSLKDSDDSFRHEFLASASAKRLQRMVATKVIKNFPALVKRCLNNFFLDELEKQQRRKDIARRRGGEDASDEVEEESSQARDDAGCYIEQCFDEQIRLIVGLGTPRSQRDTDRAAFLLVDERMRLVLFLADSTAFVVGEWLQRYGQECEDQCARASEALWPWTEAVAARVFCRRFGTTIKDDWARGVTAFREKPDWFSDGLNALNQFTYFALVQQEPTATGKNRTNGVDQWRVRARKMFLRDCGRTPKEVAGLFPWWTIGKTVVRTATNCGADP